MLREESFEVLVHLVQEGVDFLQRRFCQSLYHTNALINHSCELATFIFIFLAVEVHFVQEDLADLDYLGLVQLKVFVSRWHLEVRVDEVEKTECIVT